MADQSDVAQLDRLIGGPTPEMPKYSSKEWTFVQSTISGGAFANKIEFSTQAVKSYVVWSEAFVRYTLHVTGTAFDATTALAFREHCISTIYGVVVNVGSNNIVNLQHVNRMAWVRRQIGESVDKAMRDADLFQSSPDSIVNQSSTSNPVTEVVANAATENGTKYAAATPLYGQADNANIGLGRRQICMKKYQQPDFSYHVELHIPLRLLCGFFEKLDFAVSSLDMLITLQMSGTPYSTEFLPVSLAYDAAQAGSAPVIQVLAGSQPRLYYPKVSFEPADARDIEQIISAGSVYRLQYNDHTKYRYTGDSTANHIEWQVSPSIKGVKRVWLMLTKRTQVTAGVYRSQLNDAYSMGYNVQGACTNINLRLNNVPYFENTVQSDAEAWELVKDLMKEGGASQQGELLSFKQWREHSRVYAFNVERSHLSDPTLPQSVYLSFDRAGSSADGSIQTLTQLTDNFEIECIVEYEQMVELNLAAATVIRL